MAFYYSSLSDLAIRLQASQQINTIGVNRINSTIQAQIQPQRRIQDPSPVVYGPDKEVMTFNLENQAGACGVGNMYAFHKYNLNSINIRDCPYYENAFTQENIHSLSGGCGFLSVAFIDTPDCKLMFQKLKEWFPILYQSPIRYNKNSENNFFFVIFDTGEKEKNADDGDGEGFLNGLDW